jgi:hypothetical protein
MAFHNIAVGLVHLRGGSPTTCGGSLEPGERGKKEWRRDRARVILGQVINLVVPDFATVNGGCGLKRRSGFEPRELPELRRAL